jgi:hypothetical protein
MAGEQVQTEHYRDVVLHYSVSVSFCVGLQ